MFCFSFCFFLLSIKKTRKIHAKLACASKFTLIVINFMNFMNFGFIFKFFLLQHKKIYPLKLIEH